MDCANLIAFVIMATATTHAIGNSQTPPRGVPKNGIPAGLLFYFVSGAGARSVAGWRLGRSSQPQPA